MGKLSNTLIKVKVPEKRGGVTSQSTVSGTNEIDPVSQSYVNKK
ncbi:hypothetical protein OH492_16580 [Vibrio chagasii]|nr:hypothetical protein [Vibrio chagasii]